MEAAGDFREEQGGDGEGRGEAGQVDSGKVVSHCEGDRKVKLLISNSMWYQTFVSELHTS